MMSSISVWSSLQRILVRSGVSPLALLGGVGLRVLERCLELVPYLLGVLWLYVVIQGDEYGEPWLLEPAWVAVIIGGSLFFQWAAAWWGQRCCFLQSYRIMAGYRKKLIEHVRQAPIGEIRSGRLGEWTDVLTDDINRVESIFSHVLADFLSAIGLACVSLLILAIIDWKLAIALASLMPLAVVVMVVSRNLFEREGLKKHSLCQQTSALLIEFISGLTTLRLFNRTDDWKELLGKAFTELRHMSLSIEKWGGGPVLLFRFITESGLVVVLLLGVWGGLDAPETSLGWLALCLLAYKLLGPLLEVAEYLVMLRHACQSEASLEEAWALRSLPEPDIATAPVGYAVSFEDVHFAYGQQPILRGVSFEVPEGSTTAIVGPSGAGKTTLLHLLMRFHDPDMGGVRIGDVDLREVGSARLYELISAVFQQVQVFDGSVLDNLRAAREDATLEEVRLACRRADFMGVIERLCDGEETLVGESGFGLSGGERQRLSIARALLKDAPLLLFDEGTASVDPQSQAAIQRSLDTLTQGRTVIMVAHRLYTIRNVDQIIVMDKGSVVESGCHEGLLLRNGLYAELWAAQQFRESTAVKGGEMK